MSRTGVVGLGFLALLALTLPGPLASAASSAVPRTREPLARTPSGLVPLITGDGVIVGSSSTGRPTASFQPADPAHGGFLKMFTAGQQFVFPQPAVHLLGSVLDPELFDVTQQALHADDALRVRLTLAPDARVVRLPGATLERLSPTSAVAHFTRSSSRQFGAALAAGASLPGIVHVSPIWVTPMAPASGAMDTLTVKGSDWQGLPDSEGGVDVFNLDHLDHGGKTAGFKDGVASFQLRPGHYFADGFFYDQSANRWYITTNPEFTVSGDSSISFDARDATADIAIALPKPANQAVLEFTIARSGRGTANGDGAAVFGDGSLRVQPVTTPPRAGHLYSYSDDEADSPAGVKHPYTFNAVCLNAGNLIPADEHCEVAASSLAAVPATYVGADQSQTSVVARFHFLPWEQAAFASAFEVAVPVTRTEYYTATDDLLWESSDSAVSPDQDNITSAPRTYAPGPQPATMWGLQPRHPMLFQNSSFTVCPACESATTMFANVYPFGDNVRSHQGYVDFDTSGISESLPWKIAANGTSIASGNGEFQASAGLIDGTKTYALSYDNIRKGAQFKLSTDSATTWTVPANAPLAALPVHWYCSWAGSRDCSVLPLMTTAYTLPVDSLGRLAPGSISASVAIGHLVGARKVAVQSVKAHVSFDGGSTWSAVTVKAQRAGAYSLSFTVPPKGQTDGFGALELTATDALGGTVSDTMIQAFAIGG